MSLVPPAPPEPSTGPAASSPMSTVSAFAFTMSQSNGAVVTTSGHTRSSPSLSSMDSILRANGSATISFLTAIPNVKKWANVLTFRQSSSPSSPSGPSSSATPPPPDRLDDKGPGDIQPPSSRTRSLAPCETEPGTIQPANSLSPPSIDQTSLSEAIASINRGPPGLPESDLQRRLQQQPPADATVRLVSTGQDQVQSRPLPMLTPAMSHMDPPGAIIDGLPGAECSPSMGPSPSPNPSLHTFEPGNPIQEEIVCTLEAKKEPDAPTDASEETPVAPAPPTPLPPPEAFFVSVNVHLEDPETQALRMRRAYHMSVRPMWKG